MCGTAQWFTTTVSTSWVKRQRRSSTNPKVSRSIPLPPFRMPMCPWAGQFTPTLPLTVLPGVNECDRKSVVNNSTVWICKALWVVTMTRKSRYKYSPFTTLRWDDSFLTSVCFGCAVCTYSLLASQLSLKCLTQRHYREVFATELAGNGDFLPQGPALFGNHMMCSSRGVMAHLSRRRIQGMCSYKQQRLGGQ